MRTIVGKVKGQRNWIKNNGFFIAHLSRGGSVPIEQLGSMSVVRGLSSDVCLTCVVECLLNLAELHEDTRCLIKMIRPKLMVLILLSKKNQTKTRFF